MFTIGIRDLGSSRVEPNEQEKAEIESFEKQKAELDKTLAGIDEEFERKKAETTRERESHSAIPWLFDVDEYEHTSERPRTSFSTAQN